MAVARSSVTMIAVISSSVAAVGYDAGSLELYVRFHGSTRTYVYSGVPVRLFEDFLRSSSKGRFFTATIRGRFPFRRTL